MKAKKGRYGLTDDAVTVLYYRYRALCVSGEEVAWDNFDDFVLWCSDKWGYGKYLVRDDESKPYSSRNCKWVNGNTDTAKKERMREFIKSWDNLTGPLRKAYAEELQMVSDGRSKQYFRYEHPDLVREGILFIGNNPE